MALRITMAFPHYSSWEMGRPAKSQKHSQKAFPASPAAIIEEPTQRVRRLIQKPGPPARHLISQQVITRLCPPHGGGAVAEDLAAAFAACSSRLVSRCAPKYASAGPASAKWLSSPSRRIFSRLARTTKLAASTSTSHLATSPLNPTRKTSVK